MSTGLQGGATGSQGGAGVWLSVVVPAYNEARRIGETLRSILAYLDSRDYASEVIVVDDGSEDGTCDVAGAALAGRANGLVLSCRPNRGKGSAVRRGILESRGKYVLFMDADSSTPIDQIEKAFQCLQSGSRIAIGSRGVPGAEILVRQPRYREWAAKIFNLLRFLMLGIRVPDTQCGFKLFEGELARAIFGCQRVDGFMFDVETLYIAQRLKLPVGQFPVRWHDSSESKLRIVWDTLRMFKDLAVIRIHHRPARLNAVLGPVAGGRGSGPPAGQPELASGRRAKAT